MVDKVGGLLLCIVLIAGCGPLRVPTPDRSQGQSTVSQLAYVGSDDQVYVAAPDGSGARSLTQRVIGLSADPGWTFRWPTYSQDGRRVAFAGYRSRAGQLLSAAVIVTDLAQEVTTVALESADLAPIYLYWSPDNRHLTALLQHDQSLELYLFDAVGQEQARRLLVGQPLYWSWAQDGKSLAVHLGDATSNTDPGWVGLLHLDSAAQREERFSDTPGAFRAPAWSPNGGRLAYAALGGGTSIVTVRDAAGQQTRLASGANDVVFTWSPDGMWLAFAFGVPGGRGLYQGVEVARADGSDRHRVTQEPTAAFYWAPDSVRLAFLGIDSSMRGLAWSVVNADGKGARTLASFVPSDDFAFQVPFFDQYAQSTTLWAPDSHRLVYGAAGSGDRSNGSAAGERIMSLDVQGQMPPAAVAQGSIAVWSPAGVR